ncbi:hypothetical protein ANN_12138 [Periplaneta americana]|uniref:Uncharacterized protein n=1 Tax=Periplaneta americana TaxID=6978 RepID=A0ABQ8T721_PERAM|nr:hypothetical protein ANN_12138 [Periplaneta americana]
MTIQSRQSTGGHAQHTSKVCADRGKHHTGKATQKYTTIYYAMWDFVSGIASKSTIQERIIGSSSEKTLMLR